MWVTFAESPVPRPPSLADRHDHARTPHGFALAPDISTEYTEAADRRSTRAMWAMIKESWPDAPIVPIELNACGTVIHPKQ